MHSNIHLEPLIIFHTHYIYVRTESQVLFTYHLLYRLSYAHTYATTCLYTTFIHIRYDSYTRQQNILSTLYRSHRELSDRQHESESGESTEQSKIQVS